MTGLTAFLSPLVMLLPLAAPAGDGEAALTPRDVAVEEARADLPSAPDWLAPETMRDRMGWDQVRIQRRVVVRIVPRPVAQRQSLVAEQRVVRTPPPRYVERKVGKCLEVSDIRGVRAAGDSKLMLFMRDRRMIAANLEKACRAQDFYSGFYLERNKDGRLCVDRDRLQSRSGANCEVTRLRQMVAEKRED